MSDPNFPITVLYAKHYLSVLRRLADGYKEGGEAAEEALYGFEQHWSQINRAWQKAIRYLDQDETAAHLASGFGLAGEDLFHLRLPPGERVRRARAGIRAARRLADNHALCFHTGHLGVALKEQGAYLRAIRCFRHQMTLTRQLGDRRAECRVVGHLGVMHKNAGEYWQAIECYEQQLALAREINDRISMGKALGNMGVALRHQRRYEEALDAYWERLALAEKYRDERGRARTLENMGLVALDCGRREKAAALFRESLELFRRLGDHIGETQALGNLGKTKRLQGDYRQAHEILKQVLERSRGHGELLLTTRSTMADLYLDLAQFQQALEYASKALTQARDHRARPVEADSLWQIARARSELGDKPGACEAARLALEIFEEFGSPLTSEAQAFLGRHRANQ